MYTKSFFFSRFLIEKTNNCSPIPPPKKTYFSRFFFNDFPLLTFVNLNINRKKIKFKFLKSQPSFSVLKKTISFN